MKKVNHESDFIATLTLPTEAVNADFIIEFSTRGNATYTASRIGTVYTNCALVNSQIVVGFRNHKLPCGMLNAKYALLLDNGYMSDGILRKVVPNVEAVELVTGRGDDEAISLSLVTDLSLESLYNMVRLHGYTDTEFKFYESWIAAMKNTVVSGDTTIGVNFVLEGYLHCASAQIGGKDVTAEKITQWDTAYAKSHTHQNEAVIDEITQDSVDNWDTAYTNSLTQQEILASLARWSDMFTLETDKNGTTYVRVKYDLMSERGVATYSGMEAVVPSVFSGMPIDGKSIYWDNGILKSYNVGGDGHTHKNKVVLDTLTPGLIKEWDTAYANNHTHANKTVIDGIDQNKTSSWDKASANSHTHANKTVIDGIDQNKTSSWDKASANNHTHANKSALDGISNTKVSEWNNKVASVVLDGLLLKVNNAGTVVTYSVPVASDNASGAVSTTAQTFAGKKTFKNGIIANGIDFESDTQIAQQWFKSTIDGVMTTFGAIGTYGNGIDMFIACQRSGKQLYLANDGRLGYGDWDNGMAYLKVEKDSDGNAIFSYENNIKTPNYIQIGDYRIVVDTANNALKIVKADGTAANLIVSGGTTTYE